MAAYLSPVFGAGAQLFTNQGIVLSGGKIWTYQAGTTTPYTTWTDSTQLVANANPIILDSAGRPSNEIWLAASINYKLILMDSNDNILGTWDNIAGLNDITTSLTTTEWSATNLTPSYISTTSFSVTGNNTSTFTVNRRLKIAVSAGTVYGYVYSSSYGSGITTVVIQPDSTVLDSGISSVSVGLLNASNPSVPQQYLAANSPISIAASATTNIGAALSTTVTITGTTTITAFDTVLAGIYRFVNWSAATPITYNATNMQLIGSVSRTNNAGDFSIFRSLGSGNWIEEIYQQHTGNITATAQYATTLTTTIQSGVVATTQLAGDNSTKVATTAYVDRLKNLEIFTSSGTWTKPVGIAANSLIQIEGWGGGGGGSTANDGGGGGGYSTIILKASSFGATETVTIGAGGAAGATGGTGGNSSVGTLLIAYGGGGGQAGTGGGGGGGTGGAGAPATAGAAVVVASVNAFVVNEAGGSTYGAVPQGRANIYGGGCGGRAGAGYGGGSYYGGGGGSSDGAPSGGLGYYGGAGGASGSSGVAPGGGGGLNGAGARGEIHIRILG